MKKIILFLIFICCMSYIFADTTISVCTYNVTTSGKYNLTATLTCPVNAINVKVSDVEINCLGNTINFGSGGAANTNGIYAINTTVTAKSNLTIKNCIISRNSTVLANNYGIFLANFSSSYIFNNTISTNGTTDNYGIYIIQSDYTRIDGNILRAKGSTTNNYGIFVARGNDYVNITSNTITSAGTTGSTDIFFAVGTEPTSNILVKGNNLQAKLGTTAGYNIYINANVTSLIVRDNNMSVLATGAGTAVSVYSLGVAGSNTDNNVFINNTHDVRSTGAGTNYIYQFGGNNNFNNITDNTGFVNGTASVSAVYGIGTAVLPIYNINILRNKFDVNSTVASNHVIYLTANLNNTNISYNNLSSTGGTTPNYGVYILGTTALIAQNNDVSYNRINITASGADATGILISTNADNNNVVGNTINVAGTTTCDGIRFLGTTLVSTANNFVSSNTVYGRGTGGRGIHSTINTDGNTITNNNLFIGNATSLTLNLGVYVFGSTMHSNNNIITGNNIRTLGTGITNNGIFVSTNASNNLIQNNIVNMTAGGAGTSYVIQILGTAGFPADGTIINRNNITWNCPLLCMGIYATSNVHYINITNNKVRNDKFTANGGSTGQGISVVGSTLATLNVTDVRIIGNDVFIDANSTATTVYGVQVSTSIDRVFINNNVIVVNGSSAGYGIIHISAVASPGNDFTITFNNITTYGTAGSNNAILFSTTLSRFTINDNIINAGIGGTTLNRGIMGTGLANTTIGPGYIQRNKIYTYGSGITNDAVYLATSYSNVNITDNLLIAQGSSTNGIVVTGVALGNMENYTIINNIINVTNNTALGTNVGINLISAIYNHYVYNNTIRVYGTTSNKGIIIIGVAALPVNNNIIDSNNVGVYTPLAGGATTYGIELSAMCDNNRVTNNIIDATGTATLSGIHLLSAVTTPCNYNVIDRNNITMVGGTTGNYGIYESNTWHYSNITNNRLNLNAGTTGPIGIVMLGIEGDPSIDNNIVENNNIQVYSGTTTTYGISMSTNIQNNIVRYNNFNISADTEATGFYFIGVADGDTNNNLITFNNFTSTVTGSAGMGGIMGYTMDNNTVSNNRFIINDKTIGWGIEIISSSANDMGTNYINDNYIWVNSSGNGNTVRGIYGIANVNNFEIYNNNIIVYTNKTSEGIYFIGSTNPVTDNKIYNNSIVIEGPQTGAAAVTGLVGIRLNIGVNGNNISNNYISTKGRAAGYGVNIITSGDNIVYNNKIVTMDTTNTSAAIYIVGNSKRSIIENNLIDDADGSAFRLDYVGFPPDDTIIKGNTINNVSMFDLYVVNTAIKSIDNLQIINQHLNDYNFTLSGTSNLIIENTSTGKIQFSQNIIGYGVNLSNRIRLGPNNLSIDTSDGVIIWNKSATLTFYNVPSLSSPAAYRDGELCTGGICGTLTYLGNNVYTYTVTGWSSYSVSQDFGIFKTPCTICHTLQCLATFNTNSNTTCIEFDYILTNLETTFKMGGNAGLVMNTTACDPGTSIAVSSGGNLCDWMRGVIDSRHATLSNTSLNRTSTYMGGIANNTINSTTIIVTG